MRLPPTAYRYCFRLPPTVYFKNESSPPVRASIHGNHEQTQNRPIRRHSGISRHDRHFAAGGTPGRPRAAGATAGAGFARVGVVAEVSERVRLPVTGCAVHTALHRGVPGAARRVRRGCASRGCRRTAGPACRPRTLTHELEREYRAVVEEILELRGDDGRISAFVRSITEARRPGRHSRLFAGPERRPEARAARDARRRRAAQAGAAAAAGTAGRAAGPQAHPRRRRGRRPEAAARILPAQADGRDPQGARRRRRLRLEDYREKIADAGMPDAVRQQAERELVAPRAHGRCERRIVR